MIANQQEQHACKMTANYAYYIADLTQLYITRLYFTCYLRAFQVLYTIRFLEKGIKIKVNRIILD